MRKIQRFESHLEQHIRNFLFGISLFFKAKKIKLLIKNDIVNLEYFLGERFDETKEKDLIKIETDYEKNLKLILYIKSLIPFDSTSYFNLRNNLQLLKDYIFLEIQIFLRREWQKLGFSVNVFKLVGYSYKDVAKHAFEFIHLFFGLPCAGLAFLEGKENFIYPENERKQSILESLCCHIKKIMIKEKIESFKGTLFNYYIYARYAEPYILCIFFEKEPSPFYTLAISFLINELMWIFVNLKIYKMEEEAFSSLIKVLVQSLDAKDIYTRGHSEGVTFYAVEIGKRCGLNMEELENLKNAALLHDIGKIGIPDTILMKPGKLTPREFEIIKLHPVLGEKIVSQGKSLSHLARIIRHHHEKWNGTGYPDGLKEERIPFFARIITLADVYDALTHKRIYRDALPKERVLEIIKAGKGSHFDPELTEIALEVFDKFPLYIPPEEETITSYLETIREEIFFKDPSTGVYNFSAFVKHSEDFRTKIPIFFISLKNFYYYNLIKGPVFTDKLIISISEVLVKHFGEENVYRIGPDEFVIIYFKKEDAKKIKEVIKNIEKKFKVDLYFEQLEILYTPEKVETVVKNIKLKKSESFILYTNFITLKKLFKVVAVLNKNKEVIFYKGVRKKEIENLINKEKRLIPVKYLRKTLGYLLLKNPLYLFN